jgi:dTDP-4-amino-4,6-dideoxygalactose transaminase
LLLKNIADRERFIESMKADGIGCVFHYVPLHSAPEGRKKSRANGELSVTSSVADRLVRLPLWLGLESEQERVIQSIFLFFREKLKERLPESAP